jgi:uncharacterized protein (TIGR02246 family)
LRQQWEKAFNDRNLEALLGLYAENAVLVVDGKPVTGRENIETRLKKIMGESSDLKLIPATADSRQAAQDSGTFEFTRAVTVKVGDKDLSGGLLPDRRVKGTYRVALKRERAKWTIVEHELSDISTEPLK